MTLPLTAEMLEACYDFLCTTPPFNTMGMPHGEDVKFVVNRKIKNKFATYHWDGKQHVITLAGNAIGHVYTLLENLSHEMVHLWLEENEIESRGHDSIHNPEFRRRAAQICKYLGFDPKAFY